MGAKRGGRDRRRPIPGRRSGGGAPLSCGQAAQSSPSAASTASLSAASLALRVLLFVRNTTSFTPCSWPSMTTVSMWARGTVRLPVRFLYCCRARIPRSNAPAVDAVFLAGAAGSGTSPSASSRFCSWGRWAYGVCGRRVPEAAVGRRCPATGPGGHLQPLSDGLYDLPGQGTCGPAQGLHQPDSDI